MAVNIPRNISEATKSLARLDRLVTAREWERAAIVFAFTREVGPGARTDLGRSAQVVTFNQFAELGIAGLRSHHTVAKYHRAWQHAVDLGEARPVRPGQARVGLPKDLPWPPTGNPRGFVDRFAKNAPPEAKAEGIRELLADGDILDAFVESSTSDTKANLATTLLADPAVADLAVADTRARSNVKRATDRHYKRQATNRRERTDRIAASDDTDRRIDALLWVTRLGETCERFSRDGNDALRQVGPLPESERYWLTGAIDRAEATIRAARRYLDVGKSDFDAELEALLNEEA